MNGRILKARASRLVPVSRRPTCSRAALQQVGGTVFGDSYHIASGVKGQIFYQDLMETPTVMRLCPRMPAQVRRLAT